MKKCEMIQKTVNRLGSLVAPEDVFIVTNESYAALVKEQLPQLHEENILLEPAARNTAPCIGLAAAVVRKKYGDAVMAVLPSDHLIKFNQMFIDTLKTAAEVAEKGSGLVTIGITPTCPETMSFKTRTMLSLTLKRSIGRAVCPLLFQTPPHCPRSWVTAVFPLTR